MKPNCIKCKHYYITFDQATPRGCRAYQIQSKQMPNQIIKAANSGQDCIGFQPKPERNANTKTKDLNDSKYW